MTTEDGPSKSPEAIHLRIPPRYLVLPFAGAMTGLSIGLIRGARTTSWRFLAENAHRPPTTVQGWYFYKKTKNYRMMLGGLQEAGRDSAKLGLTALGWVGAEDALSRAGLSDVSEIGAGLFTAGTFAAVCESNARAYHTLVDVCVDRLPWKSSRHAIFLGLMIGGTTRFLRWIKGNLQEQQALRLAEVEVGSDLDGTVEDVDNKKDS